MFLNNRLKPQMLSAYNILEHNQDGKYDICYGEIADGNIINIAYKVNGGKVIPEDINYKEFLKDNGEDISATVFLSYFKSDILHKSIIL